MVECCNNEQMVPSFRSVRFSILSSVLTLIFLGSLRGQSAASSVSPELAHRIESMLRSKLDLPLASSISFGARSAGEIPGYDRIVAHFSSSLSPEKGGRVEDWRGVPKVKPSCFSPFPLGVPQ
jgi:hypothetical protein